MSSTNTLNKFSAQHRANAILIAPGTLSTPTNRFDLTVTASLLNGTGLGNADQVYAASVTLAPKADTSIDLLGFEPDGLGGVVNIVRLKYFWIQNNNPLTDNGTLIVGAPNTGSEYYELGGAEYGPLPHEFPVVPQGFRIEFNPAGWTPAVNGISDWIYIYNSGTVSVNFEILLVGASA